MFKKLKLNKMFSIGKTNLLILIQMEISLCLFNCILQELSSAQPIEPYLLLHQQHGVELS